RRRVRAAEVLDQPVVASAAENGALRAEAVGDELEGGVAIVVEAADQRRRTLPGDARRLKPLADLAEIVLRFARKVVVDLRRIGHERLVARVLAVEDAQRIAVEAVLAVLRQIRAIGAEVGHERRPPALA